ncbi:MAG: DNA polymerase III subunit delta' [Sterolibacterium sp.]|nr:DNA polymerase III subunit delta' [Sterolibacterium sp.]
MNIFKWQKILWGQLLANTKNLPHALLMAGPEGVGKLAFAQAFAARLLCERPGSDSFACGHCSSCTWLASDNHPDFRIIQPEEEVGENTEEGSQSTSPSSKSGTGPIRVDRIRALADFVFVGSHRHGCRIAIISPAESLNPTAANALLKILEEPPAGVYFILISSSWQRLIPTLRSRCRTILFGRPDPLLAEQWLATIGGKSASELLKLAGGAPLLAANWMEQGNLDSYHKAIEALADKPSDPIAMAARWGVLLKSGQEFGLPQLVEAVQKWVFDLILLKIAGGLRYHEAWRSKLEVLVTRASDTGLLICYQDILRIKAVVRHPLNTQLLLEDLATRYLRLMATGRA